MNFLYLDDALKEALNTSFWGGIIIPAKKTKELRTKIIKTIYLPLKDIFEERNTCGLSGIIEINAKNLLSHESWTDKDRLMVYKQVINFVNQNKISIVLFGYEQANKIEAELQKGRITGSNGKPVTKKLTYDYAHEINCLLKNLTNLGYKDIVSIIDGSPDNENKTFARMITTYWVQNISIEESQTLDKNYKQNFKKIWNFFDNLSSEILFTPSKNCLYLQILDLILEVIAIERTNKKLSPFRKEISELEEKIDPKLIIYDRFDQNWSWFNIPNNEYFAQVQNDN